MSPFTTLMTLATLAVAHDDLAHVGVVAQPRAAPLPSARPTTGPSAAGFAHARPTAPRTPAPLTD